jgi:APA family basic amino acid/polyamine antiporter
VELVSIGTLFAFLLVCFSIMVLRKTQPNRPRPFRVPYAPYLPGLGVVACAILMLSLPWGNWVRLIVWLAIGMAVYLLYAKKRAARLRRQFTGTTFFIYVIKL